MLEDGNYIVDWNILMSLRCVIFAIVFLFLNIIGRASCCLVEEGSNKLEHMGVQTVQITLEYAVSNTFACSEVCVNLAYTMQRYMGLKVQETWRIRHRIISWICLRKFATTENTSNVLGQRSSQCFETLLQWCVYFCYFPSSSDLLFNQWLSIWRLDC